MSGHTVSSFDQELEQLAAMVAEMGELAKISVRDAIAALSNCDEELAQKVVDSDVHLDALQRKVEDRVTLMITRRQPMAQDLREIMASMRIAGDLERVGDLSKNIAKRIKHSKNSCFMKNLVSGVERLADKAVLQLSRVLGSFISDDIVEAMAVWHGDVEINAAYTSLFRELLTYMMEDSRTITFCTHLLFCAKNLERIGDHVQNISETVYYSLTGEQPQ